jgi:prostaglandin-E synthase 1
MSGGMSPGGLGIDYFIAHPAFRTYALCAAILGLKMLFSAIYTGVQRQRHQGYVNAEDARAFGRSGARAGTEESPAVAHALRIQRNDLENIPLFFAIGLTYVLAGASPIGAVVCCWAFTLARIAHTFAYTWNLQPWRAIFYGIGTFAILAMIVMIIVAVL